MWKALAALCVGLFITLLDQSLVAVALPDIVEHFDATVNQGVWVSAVYLLTFAVPLLMTGRLGDRFGQRNVYLAGMSVFVLAAALCAFAPTIEFLIIARAIQGFGASLLNPQPLAIINKIFPFHKRGTAMGIWSAVAGSSGLFGPVAGGLLVGWFGWHSVFWVYVPLGVVSLILVAAWVPRLPTAASRIDPFSALLSLVAVFAVVFTLQQGPELNWPVWIFVLLGAGVLASVVFYLLQRRAGDAALVPLRLFDTHNFRHGSISVFTLGFAIYSINLPIMLHLQTGLGLSPEVAGLLLLPEAVLSVVLAPLVGRLTDRLPPGTISKIGFSVLIITIATLSLMMFTELSAGWLLIPLTAIGAGNAMCWSANSAISMRSVPQDIVGAASGVYNTSRQVGAVIGAATVGLIMQIGLRHLDFSQAMGASLIFHIIVLLIGLLAVSRFRPDAPEPVESAQQTQR